MFTLPAACLKNQQEEDRSWAIIYAFSSPLTRPTATLSLMERGV
jgi:hypothetical protein